MMNGTEQFVAAQRAMLETAQSVGLKSLEGLGRLVDLNMQALRGNLTDATAQMKSMMDVKDAAKFAEHASGLAQPAAEKAQAYVKQAYEIVSATGAEIAELVQKQVAASQELAVSMVDTAAKGAPAGSEQVFSIAKNGLSAARSAYEQAVVATKRMTEVAESNIATAVEKAQAVRPVVAAKKPATV